MSIDRDQDPFETATAWFMAARARPLSAAKRRRLRAWLSRDLRHAVALDQVERAWREAVPPIVVTKPPPTAFAPSRRNRIGADRRDDRRRSLIRAPAHASAPGLGRIATMAAAGLGALCLAVGVAYRPIAYSAPSDASLDVILADGSRMHLAPGGVATLRWTPLTRRISLEEGRAEYVVAHGQRRPFVVEDGRISVRATGTRFTVDHGRRETLVLLAEGGVELIDPNHDTVRARMRPGDRVWIGADRGLRLVAGGLEGSVDPRSLMLEFDRLPLRQALARFTDGTPIVATMDPDLEAIQISGVYKKADIVAFLNSLATVEPIRWRRVGATHVVLETSPADTASQ